jgi:DNA (cytosine-5)-methyltransferase 1
MSAHPKFKLLDLFSGIGGFSLGLERTGGFETVAFCEIDKKAAASLAINFPGVPIYADVRAVTAERLRADGIEVDVVCGGFPCQDISSDGTRAGLDGERSGLWFEMARIVGELRPRFVIVENVAELLANGFDAVLGSLASIGYNAEWDCIPASAVGAPHPRDRVWIIAYPSEVTGVHESDAWKTAQRLLDHPTYWQANPWNEAAPALCRMDDGVPDRVDRTEQLGNAVVPQIPELIGRAILAAHHSASELERAA